MIIEEKDFKLEFNQSCYRFDLYLPYIVNAKDNDKKREEFRIVSHDSTLENCLRKIIDYKISKELEVGSFKQYVDLFKKYVLELKSLFDVNHELLLKK